MGPTTHIVKYLQLLNKFYSNEVIALEMQKMKIVFIEG